MEDSMLLSLIALAGTIATLIVGWLKERDKYKFDIRLKELEWKQAECERQSKRQEATIETQAKEIEKLKRRDDEDKEQLSLEIQSVKKEIDKIV